MTPDAMGLGATAGVALVTGYLSWRQIQPGISLLGPTASATIIMGIIALVWFFALKNSGGPIRRRLLKSFVALLCVLPPVWALFGVLPASIMWDSAAVTTAQRIISSGTEACQRVTSGSIGLLKAPYLVCSSNPGDGHVVTFTTLDQGRGYAYVQQRLAMNWFPNECASHLEGHWWAFNSSVNPSNGGSCPTGFPEQPAA